MFLYQFITDLLTSIMYSYNNFTFMIEKTFFDEFVTLAVYQKKILLFVLLCLDFNFSIELDAKKRIALIRLNKVQIHLSFLKVTPLEIHRIPI